MAKKRTGLGRGLAELLGQTDEVSREVLNSYPAEEWNEDPDSDRKSKKSNADRAVRAADADFGGAALFAESETDGHDLAGEAQRAGLRELAVTEIRPNPRQPRRSITREALEELAQSIESVGVVQPVIVRPTGDGYELIAGERRWRAAQMAGFTVIPAIVRTASDVESLELALVENLVRQQLNPVDEAYALQVLLEDLGVTQEVLAARIGRSRSAIANKIRLLELPGAIQEFLAEGRLTEGHGRALLGLRERGKQLRLARRVAESDLSVRHTEAEVRRLSDGAGPETTKQRSSQLPSDLLEEAVSRFQHLVGVPPKVRMRGDGGLIEIPFGSPADLERILDRIPGAITRD